MLPNQLAHPPDPVHRLLYSTAGLSDVHTLWPEVTSPVARRVLAHLFNMSTCITDSREWSSYGQEFTPQDLTYALRLRQRLRESTLAAQLAAGPDAIPDIAEAAAAWQAYLARLSKPRTLEQYIEYLVNNVDWILDPRSRPTWRVDLERGRNTLLLVLLLFTAAGILLISRVDELYTLLVGVSALFLLVIFLRTGARLRLNTYKTIHATELYWYLRQAYSDSGFPAEKLPDPSQPHENDLPWWTV